LPYMVQRNLFLPFYRSLVATSYIEVRILKDHPI
jgi:hypothetical protein